MNCLRTRLALFARLSVLALTACGGQALNGLESDSGSDTIACVESPCAPDEDWNQASCRCESRDAAVPADAGVTCPQILCPAGSVQGFSGGQCACVPIDRGILSDSSLPADSPSEVSRADAPPEAPYYVPDVSVVDVTVGDVTLPDVYYSPDVYYLPDIYSYDAQPYCAPTECGDGYEAVLNSPGGYCQCVPCTNVCPSGQTPTAGCGSCKACSTKCPAGFVYGSGCNCGPPGTDAGPNLDAGVATCNLQGYTTCTAGSWCPLGTCPDGTTQYGCYCNSDGTASCNVACPIPPPCMIPGQGSCPYGSQCVYGDCAADASATALVCSCNSGGSASCYTSSCNSLVNDAGLEAGVDGGDGGVACLLEGYTNCSAGSWCQLGICPDNKTPYGCTCNADGTASCRLTCPPASCTIPGEGTCPVNSSCTFGTCNGNSGSVLTCYCYSGSNAYCNTVSCAEAGSD